MFINSFLRKQTWKICFVSFSSRELSSTMKKLIDSKQYKKALVIFDKQSQFQTDISIGLALNASAELNDYQRGMIIKKQLSKQSLDNSVIQLSLLRFYIQCDDVKSALQLFSTITNKSYEMCVTMFKGLIKNKMPEKVVDLSAEMTSKSTDLCTLQVGKKLFHQMPNDFRNNRILLTSALHMLMKCGDVKNAENIFKLIKNKNLISYGAMMNGYLVNNMPQKALNLLEKIDVSLNDVIYTIAFGACAQLNTDQAVQIGKKLLNQMPKSFQHNNKLLTAAVHMLMKFGDIKRAEDVFQSIKNKDIISYGAMMQGYNRNNEPNKTLDLFEELKKRKLTLDEIIFTLIIGACSQIGLSSLCRSIVEQIPSNIYDNPYVRNSLIDMWGKAGSIRDAEKIFQLISNPDIVTYNAMINSYGVNGMGAEAVRLYQKIPRDLHNDVSYICVLNACSHSGLLEQARSIFNQIDNKTEWITCAIIDCLSRLFLFNEAQQLISDYEKSNPPYSIMYMCVLSAARNARDSVLSRTIYDKIRSLFPNHKEMLISGSVLLCNTYSSVNEYEQAEDIRLSRIETLGNKVQLGISWTMVNGELATFKANDRSHPRSSEIYAEVDRLLIELVEHGHKFDASWVIRPLENDETIESALGSHSEKLAIAFNLIQRPVPSTIQIAKNLRICGDCHQSTKLIAKIRQCDIIIRDANRIHHFHPNGTCSCQDHF